MSVTIYCFCFLTSRLSSHSHLNYHEVPSWRMYSWKILFTISFHSCILAQIKMNCLYAFYWWWSGFSYNLFVLGQVSGFLMLVLRECTFTGSRDVPTAKTSPYLRLAMRTLCVLTRCLDIYMLCFTKVVLPKIRWSRCIASIGIVDQQNALLYAAVELLAQRFLRRVMCTCAHSLNLKLLLVFFSFLTVVVKVCKLSCTIKTISSLLRTTVQIYLRVKSCCQTETVVHCFWQHSQKPLLFIVSIPAQLETFIQLKTCHIAFLYLSISNHFIHYTFTQRTWVLCTFFDSIGHSQEIKCVAAAAINWYIFFSAST